MLLRAFLRKIALSETLTLRDWQTAYHDIVTSIVIFFFPYHPHPPPSRQPPGRPTPRAWFRSISVPFRSFSGLFGSTRLGPFRVCFGSVSGHVSGCWVGSGWGRGFCKAKEYHYTSTIGAFWLQIRFLWNVQLMQPPYNINIGRKLATWTGPGSSGPVSSCNNCIHGVPERERERESITAREPPITKRIPHNIWCHRKRHHYRSNHFQNLFLCVVRW